MRQEALKADPKTSDDNRLEEISKRLDEITDQCRKTKDKVFKS